MGLNSGQLIFFGLIFLAGMVLGAAIALVANRGKEFPKDPEMERLKQLQSQYQQLVGLWRSRSSNQLTLRIDEQMVENGQQLSQSQRSRVQALIKEWLVWMGYPAARTAAPAPAVAPSAQLLTEAPPGSTQSFTPGERGTVQQPQTLGGRLPPVPSGATDQLVTGKPVEKPKSIVEQINEILQEKLAQSAIQSKGVRLEEDPRDGVIIWVGLERYLGVDSVTDPEVKALLKSAAAEWEKRTGRG